MATLAQLLVVAVSLVVLEAGAQLRLLEKPGSCSPATVMQVCWVVCRSDYDCPGGDKCCPTACGGSICSRPVTARSPAISPVKNGWCPAKPTGPWVCANRCSVDADCRGTLKCCRNRCGALACQRPVL